MCSTSLLGSGSVQKRTNALGGSTVLTDDLTNVVSRHAQLDNDTTVILELLDEYGIGIVHQCLGNSGNQIFEGHLGRSACGLCLLGVLNQARHRVRGFRALRLPMVDATQIEAQTSLDVRVECTHVLDETTIARIALVGHDNAVEGTLFRTVTSQSDMYSHDNLMFNEWFDFESWTGSTSSMSLQLGLSEVESNPSARSQFSESGKYFLSQDCLFPRAGIFPRGADRSTARADSQLPVSKGGGNYGSTCGRSRQSMSNSRERIEKVSSDELKSTLEKVLAPMVESDQGELFLVSASDERVVLHLRGRFAGCPGNGLVTEHIITPLVHAVLPGVEVDVSSGAILPKGATRVAAPQTPALADEGSDHAAV